MGRNPTENSRNLSAAFRFNIKALGSPHQPRRGSSPGIQMGLTVLLDVQRDECLCPGAESTGFKVCPNKMLQRLREWQPHFIPQALLHTPATQPEMLGFGHALSPGFEEFVAVSPYMIHADEGIHSLEAREEEFSLASSRNLGNNP